MHIPLELLRAFGNYLVYLSPSVVGVFVGGMFVQRYWISKANESAIIEYLTKELTDLVDETLEYWSLDCSGETKEAKENRKQAKKLEQKIKGAIKNANSLLVQYSKRYCKKVDFSSIMGEVNDACTGGKFEVVDRGPDTDRFLSVVNATHRVRWELLSRRV